MATKQTLENANIALQAQLAQMQAQMEALMTQVGQPKAEPKPKKAVEPLRVSVGYWRKQTDAGWVPDESKPRIEIRGEGVKQNMSRETFEKLFIANRDALVKQFKAL